MQFQKLKAAIDGLAAVQPEACIVVMKDHKELFRYAAGFSDAYKTTPASADDIFWIYSMTKVITMTAALRLYEQGRLGLDDPAEAYIPEFKNILLRNGSPAKTTLTVRHLMTMTAGFTYNPADFPELEKIREERSATTLDIVRAFGRGPLAFEPGSDFQYSYCHDVIGGIIEVASGMKFGEYLKREIFEPLGMNDTGFFPSEEQRLRVAAHYRVRQGDTDDPYEVMSPLRPYLFIRLAERYESGGGGLFSTATDYIKLADALACGGTSAGGYQVLRSDTVRLMRTNQLSAELVEVFRRKNNKPGYGYGLGVRTRLDAAGVRSPVGEFGWDGAAGSYVAMDPVNRLSIVYTQGITGHASIYKEHANLCELVYEGLGL